MKYNKNLLTAIIFIDNGQPLNAPGSFLKYRNIKNARYQLDRFEKFARSKTGAKHINYYHKDTKQFFKQVIL